MVRLVKRIGLWFFLIWFVASVVGAVYGWYSGVLREADVKDLESLTGRTNKVEKSFRKMLASDLLSQVGVNPRKRAEEQLFLMGGTTKGDEEWRKIAPLIFGTDAVKSMLDNVSAVSSADQADAAATPPPPPVLFPVVDIAGSMCLNKDHGLRECAVTLTVAGKSAFWVWRRQGSSDWKFTGQAPEGFRVAKPKLTGKDVGFDLVSLTAPDQSRSFVYDPAAGRTNSSSPFRQNEGAPGGNTVTPGTRNVPGAPENPGQFYSPDGTTAMQPQFPPASPATSPDGGLKVRYDDGGDFDDGDSTTTDGRLLSKSGKKKKHH